MIKEQQKITNNMLVSIEFELKNNGTGEMIDSNKGLEPLQFITGQNEIIPKLEGKIRGMYVGEEAMVVVAKEDAYGEYDNEATQLHPIERFAGMQLEVGLPLVGHDENGQQVHAKVLEVGEKDVKVDLNHPLAGIDLLFNFKILDAEIQPEKKSGGCGPSCGCKS